MILERALFPIKPRIAEDFAIAFAKARKLLEATSGFRKLEMRRGIEAPEHSCCWSGGTASRRTCRASTNLLPSWNGGPCSHPFSPVRLKGGIAGTVFERPRLPCAGAKEGGGFRFCRASDDLGGGVQRG